MRPSIALLNNSANFRYLCATCVYVPVCETQYLTTPETKQQEGGTWPAYCTAPQLDAEMKEEDEGVHEDDMHDDALEADVLDREVEQHGANRDEVGKTKSNTAEKCYIKYRVSQQVSDLGCVDFDFGYSTA